MTIIEKQQLIQQLYQYRKKKCLTIEQMAHLLNISFVTVCRWENKKGLPHNSICDRIAAIIEGE